VSLGRMLKLPVAPLSTRRWWSRGRLIGVFLDLDWFFHCQSPGNFSADALGWPTYIFRVWLLIYILI